MLVGAEGTGLSAVDDAIPFPNRDDLVGVHIPECFDHSGSRPGDLDQIDPLGFTEAKVQAQITL